MFTGIIEHSGTIEALTIHPVGGRVCILAPELAASLTISNSIAVNGCCLTVVSVDGNRFCADLSGQTIRSTSFGAAAGTLKAGDSVNLEQPLPAGKEFGGHFVLGHVDSVGRVAHLRPEGENWWYGIEVPTDFARYVVPKGSITVDGISLTVARWKVPLVEVAVIPFTYAHTNLRNKRVGDAVNLEGDVLGKYVERYLEARETPAEDTCSLSLAHLIDEGF